MLVTSNWADTGHSRYDSTHYLGEYMSLAKFRKVFKGHKKSSPPKPKVSPEDTQQTNQEHIPQASIQFTEIQKIIS